MSGEFGLSGHARSFCDALGRCVGQAGGRWPTGACPVPKQQMPPPCLGRSNRPPPCLGGILQKAATHPLSIASVCHFWLPPQVVGTRDVRDDSNSARPGRAPLFRSHLVQVTMSGQVATLWERLQGLHSATSFGQVSSTRPSSLLLVEGGARGRWLALRQGDSLTTAFRERAAGRLSLRLSSLVHRPEGTCLACPRTCLREIPISVAFRMLQGKNEQRRPRNDSSSSLAEQSEQSGSKLKAILRLRRRVRKNPISIVARYRNRSLAKLGVTILGNGTLSSPFTHRMTSERLRLAFGKMSGLRKTRHGVSEILELLEHQQVEQAAATAVQLLKDIHQAALDQESWFLASTLLPWEDPLQREVFGGDEEEM